MRIKRIKVFLGGYVNSQNAQNINCRSLSEHLNQENFEVWTMMSWFGYPDNNSFKRVPGVHYLHDTPLRILEKLHLPYWLFAWMAYAIGIIHCDVAYLPKREYVRFCKVLARFCGCKLFTTLEGVLDEELLCRQKNPNRYIDNIRCFEPNLYSITKFMAQQELTAHGLECKERVLYLGTETGLFLNDSHYLSSLRQVIMIGNDLNRKRASEFIDMASLFPNIVFHIVGGNDIKGMTVDEYVKKLGVENVFYHGMLDHNQLSETLQDMDLMFFPSRSEGFPKVMLETACAGVPTLCYSDYGANEWITDGVDGFVVDTFEEAKTVIQELIDNPEKLKPLSDAAVELGKRFDWGVLVKDWEEEIIKIYNSENEE